MLRRQSAVRHISFVELNEMLNGFSKVLQRYHINSIKPLEIEDQIPAAMLAEKLGVRIAENGKSFSVYGDKVPDICLFNKKHPENHFNNNMSISYEDIEMDVDNDYQKVVFEWNK